MKKQILLLPMLILALIFTGCSDGDDTTSDQNGGGDDNNLPIDPINEQEVITTVEITLTNDSGSYQLSWEDLDGDGPDEAIVNGATMPAGTYSCEVEIYNKTVPEEDDEYRVTLEILEEDLDHQFFFTPLNGLDVSYNYTDMDSDGNPIGQTFDLTANVSGGDLNVVLLHEPEKNAEGVPDGDMTNAGGETDIDITFPITVE